MAFFTTFAIGGMTGVVMSIPALDFQTHNSLFLVAHFHNTIIAAVTYWFPKAFGFKLDEKRGKYAFYLWVSGFYVAFMPLYVLGLMGGGKTHAIMITLLSNRILLSLRLEHY